MLNDFFAYLKVIIYLQSRFALKKNATAMYQKDLRYSKSHTSTVGCSACRGCSSLSLSGIFELSLSFLNAAILISSTFVGLLLILRKK